MNHINTHCGKFWYLVWSFLTLNSSRIELKTKFGKSHINFTNKCTSLNGLDFKKIFSNGLCIKIPKITAHFSFFYLICLHLLHICTYVNILAICYDRKSLYKKLVAVIWVTTFSALVIYIFSIVKNVYFLNSVSKYRIKNLLL